MPAVLEREIETPDSNPNPLRKEVEQWFLQLREPVFRYLRSMGCRQPLAEEITQETFLRLHRTLRSGVEIQDVRAWVFRVARNLWIDSRRADQRHFAPIRHADQAARDHRTSAPDPEREAIESEHLRILEREVARLPQLQRECVNLKARGLRYREIADALDITTTAAVDYVRRAVKKLAKLFRK